MAILRITEEKSLSKVSDLKRVPSLSIHPNPDLGRGHGPFDSFISSLKSDRSGKEIYGGNICNRLADNTVASCASNLPAFGVLFLERSGKLNGIPGTEGLVSCVMDSFGKRVGITCEIGIKFHLDVVSSEKYHLPGKSVSSPALQ
ncbi:hypothetical protein AXG93_2772s1220 [Marchantia polymorpha subsp. ruderalis]|uniref:Uncharacterized protein n=1 Tax=Marchantia polymorpha subsp. ruderalis TaxID=1480154 RepID=A0A176WI46_MARPO|nr:hypothetical protein AXG93_2772s1220 [Marchantia polymorpha subsp. ruderalis]